MPFSTSNEPQNGVVDTALLLVLGGGEGHAFLLLCTVLVGEENHEILAGEVLHQFMWQSLQGVLVRDGTFTGCDNHKHVVGTDILCQFRQFVPVVHNGVLSPHAGMVVVDVFTDELQRIITSVELDSAV